MSAVSFLECSCLLLLLLAGGAAAQYAALYNFGDSITDTGNLCVGGCPSWLTMGQPPYGETFFGYPTGRCSDGRVIVDFLADAFGLPSPPPSKAGSADYSRGANMAIIGATTMDFSFFQSIGLSNKIWNNGPLNTQIQWFQQLRPSICSSDAACRDHFSKSLFLVGEFGGNDYNAPLFSGQSIDVVKSYTPRIVTTISAAVETLIGMGARELVVPGVLPIGCFPVYLTLYGGAGAEMDGLGCLKSFNDLAANHNALLVQEVSRLRSKYPAARIMYADFYAQVTDMVRSPMSFGLMYGLRTCCGAGGQSIYNYNNDARCGMAGASSCFDPQYYLVWDGIHLTEAAYHSIADGWLQGPYCSPPILG